MMGPIFAQEMLLGGRRNRLHLLRWIYGGWLIVLCCFFYLLFEHEEQERRNEQFRFEQRLYQPRSAPQVVGGQFATAFVIQQMILLTLAVPALVAGAITDEKRRGTLEYLLTAGLDTRHIVLGKLLARMLQVVLLAMAGWPLFALLGGFGGVEPAALLILGLTLLLALFGLSALALLASVWCRQTRDAVVSVYVVAGLGWAAVWYFGGVLAYFNPFFVLLPAWGNAGPEELALAGQRLLGAVLAWGSVGMVCLGLAIWRLRPAFVRELEKPPLSSRWLFSERPAVQDDPIRWRECYVEGLAPTAALRRIPFWLALTLVAAATVVSSTLILLAALPANFTWEGAIRALAKLDMGRLTALMPQDAHLGFLIQGVAVLVLASLVVGIRCSGAVTGERERQTWEALLLTPLSARQLVHSKLWGVMGASYWYLLAYAAPAVVLSTLGGLMALFWTVAWGLVTVLAMYFIGAAGILCSVRSASSWRSLLGTLGVGYAGGIALYAVTSPVIFILAAILALFLNVFDTLLDTQMAASFNTAGWSASLWYTFLVVSCFALVVIFLLLSRLFLSRAQRYIADRERTRHWHDEPVYRRSRRPISRPRAARLESEWGERGG